jgi:hypothetical protein
MDMKILAGLGALCALSAVACASTIWNYDYSGESQNTAAGTISSLNGKFNTDSDLFEWDVTYSDGTAKDTDGFWLVISPGPNPKGHNFEFAIMYFDASDINNPNLTIFRYNGQNSENSYLNPGQLLASSRVDAGVQVKTMIATQTGASRRFQIGVDATAINGLFGPPTEPDWAGIQFGTGTNFGDQDGRIGIWMHNVRGLSTAYNDAGALIDWDYSSQGWLDLSNRPVTIPAPTAAALLGLGALVSGRRRR